MKPRIYSYEPMQWIHDTLEVDWEYEPIFSEDFPVLEQDNQPGKPKVFTFFTRENVLKARQAEYDRRREGFKVV